MGFRQTTNWISLYKPLIRSRELVRYPALPGPKTRQMHELIIQTVLGIPRFRLSFQFNLTSLVTR